MGDGLTGTLTQQQQVTMAATTMTAGSLIIASQTTVGATVITSAGTTITATLSSVGATVAGVLAGIPVAGWIALAVIAVIAAVVLIVVYWDEICEFFSGLWDSFWNWFKATIVYDVVVNTVVPWVTSTIDKLWDDSIADAPPLAIPIPAPPLAIPAPNGLEKIDPRVLKRVLEILGIIALTQELKKGEHNVYDVHVIDNSHFFNNYAPDRLDENGNKATKVDLPLKDIYKFGTTKEESVERRFGAAHIKRYDQTKPSNQRDRYVYQCLKDQVLAPTEWYLYNYAEAIALAMERILITGYKGLNGVLPAGNMITR